MSLFLDAIREAARLLLAADPYVVGVLLRSLQVSGAGLLLGIAFGLPVGIWLALGRFRGRGILIAVVNTGFALPPVVVGLFVYMLFSRQGPLGGLDLLFTTTVMIVAQAILAAPYVAGITLAAVQAVPPDVRLQARALGAGPARALVTHLREARLGIGAAMVAGFGAVISEVGAVMMVGGNVLGETRVMTTSIVLETRRGNYAVALAMGILLLLIAFVVNVVLTRLQQGEAMIGARERPWG